MKTKYTPGKWNYDSDSQIYTHYRGSKIVLASADFSHIRAAFNITEIGNSKSEIASLRKAGFGFDYQNEQANAKIMSASAELLCALKIAVAELQACGGDKETHLIIANCKQVIGLAE